ncbi:DUF5011 domain-containing protein [Dyadobacter fermentans]|nr:DUF5011 domain-containing protein [Dyadobacter fermentans]
MSCEDKTTEGISSITNYPIITIKGDQWNVVNVGGTFTDAGATATEGGQDIAVKVVGTVDTKTPGVYILEYQAVNKDGFSSVDYRYVGVISAAAAAVDISGKYQRNAGAFGVSTVTRVKGNLYKTDNVGGVLAPAAGETVYFYYYDKGKIECPYQLTPGNSFECESESIKEGVSYSWIVLNPLFGTALRTFEKL